MKGLGRGKRGVNHTENKIIGMITKKEKKLGLPIAKLKEIVPLRQLEQWLEKRA